MAESVIEVLPRPSTGPQKQSDCRILYDTVYTIRLIVMRLILHFDHLLLREKQRVLCNCTRSGLILWWIIHRNTLLYIPYKVLHFFFGVYPQHLKT